MFSISEFQNTLLKPTTETMALIAMAFDAPGVLSREEQAFENQNGRP